MTTKDDLNPNFIFSTTATQLLLDAAAGKIDLDALVRQNLVNRGVDDRGHWVGFEKALAHWSGAKAA